MKKVCLLLAALFFLMVTAKTYAVNCEDKPQPGLPPDQLISFWGDVSRACDQVLASNISTQSTLKQAISTLNSKVNLTQAQINQTTAQIASLEKDITVLGGVLETVTESMTQLTVIYQARVKESYRRSRITPIDLIFSTDSVGDYFTKLKYLNSLKAKDQLILAELENSRKDYDLRKQSKILKQQEVEKLKAKLEAQKKTLVLQQKDKQNLLDITANDEKKFQALKAEATAELEALATSQFTGKKEVKRGEVIGVMGSTGNSTGPHLHFGYYSLTEVEHSQYREGDIGWYSSKNLNPQDILSRRNILFYKKACDDTVNGNIEKDYGSGSWSWPMNQVAVTQCYGHTPFSYYYRDNFHHGLDLSGTADTLVRAVEDGVVYFYRGKSSFGNNARLFHGNGKMTLYLHLK